MKQKRSFIKQKGGNILKQKIVILMSIVLICTIPIGCNNATPSTSSTSSTISASSESSSTSSADSEFTSASSESIVSSESDPSSEGQSEEQSQTRSYESSITSSRNTSSRNSSIVDSTKTIDFYVDNINGKDSNSGTRTSPVKTLTKAQSLVRAIAATAKYDVVVNLRKGTYTLTSPWIFDGALDSLKSGKYVTYKSYNSEKVYISGGFPLNKWSVHDAGKNIVKISVPEGLKTRDISINGKQAIRARTPFLSKDTLTWKINRNQITWHDGGALAAASNPKDLEVVFNYQWCIHRVGASSVIATDEGSTITMDTLPAKLVVETSDVGPADPYGTKNIWYFENSYAFLDQPGEWYLNRSENVIYYKLRNGETMDKLYGYAGLTQQLILNDTESTTLKNIAFEGLVFCNTTWMQPEKPEGYVTIQAGFYKDPGVTATNRFDYNRWIRPDSTIRLVGTNGIKFMNNDFINLGASGIDLERSKNAEITGNLFTDIGGTSIIIGSFSPEYDQHTKDPAKITSDCLVSNNYIHNICTNMQSAAGLTVGYSQNIDLINNTIHSLPYTGISYGWGWGQLEAEYESTSSGGKIAGNLIYDVMLKVFDGGGIYTLSSRKGLVIENNYLHNVENLMGAIYQDHSSAGYTIRKNVLRNNRNHFLFTTYRTTVENNYVDDTLKVIFIGFKTKDGVPTDDYYSENCDKVIYQFSKAEWESLGNKYSLPANNTLSEADKIIAAAGVKPSYKKRFNIQ